MKSPEAKLLLDSNVLFEGYSESNKATLTVVFNIVKVLLETGMFVSAAVGGFLDNTIPGESKINTFKCGTHYCIMFNLRNRQGERYGYLEKNN